MKGGDKQQEMMNIERAKSCEESAAKAKWLMDWIYRNQGEEGLLLVAGAWRKEWGRRQRKAAWEPIEAISVPLETTKEGGGEPPSERLTDAKHSVNLRRIEGEKQTDETC